MESICGRCPNNQSGVSFVDLSDETTRGGGAGDRVSSVSGNFFGTLLSPPELHSNQRHLRLVFVAGVEVCVAMVADGGQRVRQRYSL